MLHINQRNVENRILYDLLYSLYKSTSLKSLYWYSGYIFCFMNNCEKYSKESFDNLMNLCDNLTKIKEKEIKERMVF